MVRLIVAVPVADGGVSGDAVRCTLEAREKGVVDGGGERRDGGEGTAGEAHVKV